MCSCACSGGACKRARAPCLDRSGSSATPRSESMRVGMLTTSFPRFEHDSAGTFVLGMARALAARGHEVEVLAPEPREAAPVPSWPGVWVEYVPYLRPRALQR